MRLTSSVFEILPTSLVLFVYAGARFFRCKMPTCLTCLESNANQPINSIHKTLNLQIRRIIEFCITIKLEINQNYPTAICTGCLSTLTFIYEFKQKVLASFIQLENDLHSQLASEKIKQEPKDVKPTIVPIVEEIIISAEIIENGIVNEAGTNQASNNDSGHLIECDNDFESNKELNQVKKINRHQCNKCDLSFSKLQRLNTHKSNFHPKVRPFVCSTCCKGFRKLEKLEIHEQKHTSDNYRCEVCSKCFCDELALKQHSLAHSKNDASYECKLCSVFFIGRLKFQKHVKSHRSVEKYSCMKCEQNFSNKWDFELHYRTHQLKKTKIK